MSNKSSQKTIVWALITVFLNLLFVTVPGDMVSAQSQNKQRLTTNQTADQASVLSCQTEMSPPTHFDTTGEINCPDNICDDGCSLCVQIGAVIPTGSEPAPIIEPEAVNTDDLSGLIDRGCTPITPPPKPLIEIS
jgi:hypothetical protein